MAANPLSEARKQVRNAYGAAFESKASDALVLSIAQPLTLSTSFSAARQVAFAVGPPLAARGAALPEAATAPGQPSSVILELARPETAPPAAVEAAHPAWQELSSSLEKLGAASTADAASVVRRLRATQLREAFYKSASSLREQIGRSFGGARPEAVLAAGPQALTEVCWLNNTLRTVAHLPTLAEVAQDSKVERLGLPRLLAPEAGSKIVDVLGAAAFRKKTSLTGKGVVVAILDTEIAYQHKAFQGRVILKENYTREPWGHPAEHGTAVAGLLAASATAFTGIAPEVTVYHYKVIATATFGADDFGGARAIQQALEDGAQIANCSWGIGPADHGTSREARAFDQAWDLGLTIVKSAGNVGARGLTSPGDARGVIVVGATDRLGQNVIPESSRGTTPNGRKLDCVAPGGSAQDFLTSTRPDGKTGLVGYGTSFASPQVAGLLALLLEKDKTQTPDQLRTALLATCKKLPGTMADAQGSGQPFFS
ncbi:MAG: S8 family serine peptidase [Thermoanaerobaculia bacterium]